MVVDGLWWGSVGLRVAALRWDSSGKVRIGDERGSWILGKLYHEVWKMQTRDRHAALANLLFDTGGAIRFLRGPRRSRPLAPPPCAFEPALCPRRWRSPQRKCCAFLLRTRASLVIDSDKEQSSPREAWGARGPCGGSQGRPTHTYHTSAQGSGQTGRHTGSRCCRPD